MTIKRFLSVPLLALMTLLWFASAAEAKLEPRYYPPGSGTIVAYYVPHLDITVTENLFLRGKFRKASNGVNFENAVDYIANLNYHDASHTSYLGIDTWRLPKADLRDSTCQGPLSGAAFPGNYGWYCTGSEMGYIWYTEGHGQNHGSVGVFPTNWPFTHTNYVEYWSSTHGMPQVTSKYTRESPITHLTFHMGRGLQRALHDFKIAYTWPVTDGDPLAVPALTVLKPRVDFGSVNLGETGSQQPSAEVFNAGLSPLILGPITHSNPTEFPILTDSCSGVTLAPGETCAIVFDHFKPTRDGARTATLEFISNAMSSPDIMTLVGSGVGTAAVKVTPHYLDMGSSRVRNVHGVFHNVVITNEGTAPFTVLSTNIYSTQFAIPDSNNSCLGHTIYPAGTPGERHICSITVLFHPTRAGVHSSSLILRTDSPSSRFNVVLAGTGTEAVFKYSHESLDFGKQYIGSSSSGRTVTISNTGNGRGDSISTIYTDSDEFSIVNHGCFNGLLAGSSCTFDVVFRPKSIGPRSGKLHVPNIIDSLDLRGVGEAAPTGPLHNKPKALPSDLHFGEQPFGTSSSAQQVHISNIDGVEVTISGITSSNGDFVIDSSNTCVGQTIVPNAGCAFDVSFKPGSAGAQSSDIWIYYESVWVPNLVVATGTGTGPEVTISPASLSFHGVTIGTDGIVLFSVTNTGNASLTVSALTPSQTDFTVISEGCIGHTLAVGAGCQVLLAFAPSRSGGISGKINIESNAPSSPDSVIVSGTGIDVPTDVISPTQLHFGVQHVGTVSGSRLVTITNSGTVVLPVTTVTSDTTEFTVLSDDCSGKSIPVSGSCTFGVQFSPTHTAARGGHIEVVSDAKTSPDHIAITGTGGEGQLSILPNYLNFGHQDIGMTGKLLSATVSNFGNTSVSIASVSSQNSTEFPLSPGTDTCSGSSLEPGHSCIFSVGFEPTRDGGASGTISVDSDAVKSPHSMSVSGNAIGTGHDSLAPNDLHFANRTVGSTSGARTVTLSNTDTTDVVVGTISSDNADFSVVNDSCSGATIAPLGLCDFGVTFGPSGTGAQQGHIEVSSNASSAPDHVAVTGFGVESTLLATPSHLDFASHQVGSSEARTILLSNPGTTDISVSTVSIPSGTTFTIESDGCTGKTLTPGTDCSFAVRFSPGRDGGASDVVEFVSNAATSPGYITLSGSGAGTASRLLSPTELHFGSQPVGTTTAPSVVTITNAGTTALTVTSFSSDNSAYTIVNETCTALPIVPAGTCQFGVQFSTSVSGAQTGHIAITSDGPDSPDHVALTGTGAGPAVQLSSSNIVFGTLPLGDSSAPQAITATNTGIAPLSISSIDSSNTTDFSLSADTCSSQTLAAGAQCSFSVSFKPTFDGGQSTQLQLISDAKTSPDTIVAAGSGQGAPTETFTPASLVFSYIKIDLGLSEIKQAILTNTGTADLVVGSILAASPHYSVVDNLCSGKTIAPKTFCTFGVKFEPLGFGTWSSQIEVQTNSPSSPDLLSVTGEGTEWLHLLIDAAKAIPTLSKWALAILSMLLGLIIFTNRRRLF